MSHNIFDKTLSLKNSNRNTSYTLPFENRKNIAVIALSPDSNVLISVDEGMVYDLCWYSPNYLLYCRWKSPSCEFQTRSGTTSLQLQETSQCHRVLPRWEVSMPHANTSIPFLTTSERYIAATHETHVQVWRTPNHLIREFAPFVLHREYTGHHDEVLSIQWSPDSRLVLI